MTISGKIQRYLKGRVVGLIPHRDTSFAEFSKDVNPSANAQSCRRCTFWLHR